VPAFRDAPGVEAAVQCATRPAGVPRAAFVSDALTAGPPCDRVQTGPHAT